MAKRLSWAVRLERAEKRGKFTVRERTWGSLWNRCAIGEKHGFPDTETAVLNAFDPDVEQRLGVEFCSALSHQDIPKAKRIYQLIQALP